MSKQIESLEADFSGRHKWLQDAVARILEKGILSGPDITELVTLCKAESGILEEGAEKPVFKTIPKGALQFQAAASTVKLIGISDIIGINALAPKKPLKFEDTPLVVVFGSNGSGKSGYARVLKHACGSKALPPLHRNVFTADQPDQSCKIEYSLNGTVKTTQWTAKGGPIDDLRSIAVYDTASAHVYVNDENEVTFEPRILRLFSVLVDICAQVDGALKAEILSKASSLPKLSADLVATPAGKWYGSLNHAFTQAAVDAKCSWSEEDEKKLAALRARAAEKSPAEKAAALRRTKSRMEQFLTALEGVYSQLSDGAFDLLQSARSSAKQKRKIASEEVAKVFDGGLDGIGSETWAALWKAAREYSVSEAYKEQPFPVVSIGARCVLCQQNLDETARARLASFEAFVKGELEGAASAAEASLKKIIDDLKAVASPDSLPALMDTAGVEDAGLREEITVFYSALDIRRKDFLEKDDKTKLGNRPKDDVFTKVQACVAALESKAKTFDEDAKSEKKNELRDAINEVLAQKWITEQKAAIEVEIKRLSAIHRLEDARRKTNTKWLSDTKSAISEQIVTTAFVERFNAELKALKAAKVKVKLEKTKAHKGQVLHRILIDGAVTNTSPSEVLSEGQFRIVSIAAFLADVESNSDNTPFIFDDPVCSLDLSYEGAVAGRLIELSKKRQVIVFTHRLSMVSLLTDIADKAGIEMSSVSVRSESWGAGEPDPTLLSKQKPDKAIKSLLQDRLKKARDVFNTQGRAEYDPLGKSICSDVRIIVEKSVEIVLLNDVIQRFRRVIITKDKLGPLAKIEEADCKLLDDFMTKYSFFEHDQPPEAPVEVPEPDEIEADLTKLGAWCEEFKKRMAI